MSEEEEEVWVIDTSSLCAIRREIPNRDRSRVLKALDQLVEEGKLVYPKKVLGELERATEKIKEGKHRPKTDVPLTWATRNQELGTRYEVTFERVRGVLSRVPTVLDPEKTSGEEEADPYVLGLALDLKAKGYIATVITEDSRDRPLKMSMSSACGVLKLYTLRLTVFLRDRGIWAPDE